jgi:hypothetical protein
MRLHFTLSAFLLTILMISGCQGTDGRQPSVTSTSSEKVGARGTPSTGVGQGRGEAAGGTASARGPGSPRKPPSAWEQFAEVFHVGSRAKPGNAPRWENGGTAARGSERSSGPEVAPAVPSVGPQPSAQPHPATPPLPRGPQGSGAMPSHPSPGSGGNGSKGSDGNGKPSQPDPSSDRVAPLLAGISFSPSRIADGETSTLTISATDDLSGVHSVSGTVVSPSGKATLGFATQPAGGDVYQTKITIPKDGEQGTWFVGSVYLTDKANNAANFSYTLANAAPGGRLLVVSSNSDSTPPVLRNVVLGSASIGEGETNSVVVEADDDRSGVASISGVFLSPNKTARIGFSCTSDGQPGSPWTGKVTLPRNSDCGEWKLQQIQLADKAGNRAGFGAENPLVARTAFYLSYGGVCDSKPPVLLSLYISPSSVSNTQDTEVTITATVSDEGTGVAAVTGRFDGPPSTVPGTQAPRIYFSLLGNSQDTLAPWVGHVTIPKFSARGTWITGTLTVVDKANNSKAYSQADAVLASGRFNVN